MPLSTVVPLSKPIAFMVTSGLDSSRRLEVRSLRRRGMGSEASWCIEHYRMNSKDIRHSDDQYVPVGDETDRALLAVQGTDTLSRRALDMIKLILLLRLPKHSIELLVN